MSKQLAVRVSEQQVAALDEAVASGRYASRAEALRAALEVVLAEDPGAVAPEADAAAEADAVAPEPRAAGEAGAAGALHAEVVLAEPGWAAGPRRALVRAGEPPAAAAARKAAPALLGTAAGALASALLRAATARRGVTGGVRPLPIGRDRGVLDVVVVQRLDNALGVAIRRR
jgi:Arc/MetJ-type ribon-helix-helix transcriptional regulator